MSNNLANLQSEITYASQPAELPSWVGTIDQYKTDAKNILDELYAQAHNPDGEIKLVLQNIPPVGNLHEQAQTLFWDAYLEKNSRTHQPSAEIQEIKADFIKQLEDALHYSAGKGWKVALEKGAQGKEAAGTIQLFAEQIRTQGANKSTAYLN